MEEVKLLRLELLIEIEPGITAAVKWEESSGAAIRTRKRRARQKDTVLIPPECDLVYNHYCRMIRKGASGIAKNLIWKRLKAGISADRLIEGINVAKEIYEKERRESQYKPRADNFFREGKDFDSLYYLAAPDPDEGRPFFISPEGYKIFTDGKP